MNFTDDFKYMVSDDGNVTGAIKNYHCRPCKKPGCMGWRISVLWPDGRYSYPCSRECTVIAHDTLKISVKGKRNNMTQKQKERNNDCIL